MLVFSLATVTLPKKMYFSFLLLPPCSWPGLLDVLLADGVEAGGGAGGVLPEPGEVVVLPDGHVGAGAGVGVALVRGPGRPVLVLSRGRLAHWEKE